MSSTSTPAASHPPVPSPGKGQFWQYWFIAGIFLKYLLNFNAKNAGKVCRICRNTRQNMQHTREHAVHT